MSSKLRHIALYHAVSICRLLLALTFVFSGFVKAVDPQGMVYKLNAYCAHWGWTFAENSLLLRFAVVALATLEFVLGVYIFLGIRRRLTATLTTLVMMVMTVLTVYIYLYNPVPDCGCFGDAIKLSHGATLGKNVVLTLCSLVMLVYGRYMPRLITRRNQWLTSIYSWVYAIVLTLYSFHYLPVIDFTPYQRGTNLRAAWMGTAEGDVPEELMTLSLFSLDGADDYTEQILSDTGYTFLLTIPDVTVADDGCNDRINDLHDVCMDKGWRLYGVVGDHTDSTQVNDWVDRTGAAYPFLMADAVQLKAMVRSTPGLMLLQDGIVTHKWSNNDLPDMETATAQWLAPQVSVGLQSPPVRLLLWFVVPLFAFILIDGIWIGSKYYRHYIFKKTLKQKNMRKKIVAGNWKMNKNLQEGVALAKELNAALLADKPNCDVVICTPFIHLASVANEINAEVLGLGAENCADKVSGAYTGEVSAEMVKSTGAQYVILGHSERRAYYHETAEILKEKTNLALANGLKVIFCIGEVLEERESGKQNEVVKAQLEGSLFELTKEQLANVILAYEPVWAIGTGKTATAEQAEDMHAFIRGVIAEQWGAEAAEEISILYGGSCKPSNAKEIFSKPNVDGGLIGGAALKVEDFKGIIDAWK